MLSVLGVGWFGGVLFYFLCLAVNFHLKGTSKSRSFVEIHLDCDV